MKEHARKRGPTLLVGWLRAGQNTRAEHLLRERKIGERAAFARPPRTWASTNNLFTSMFAAKTASRLDEKGSNIGVRAKNSRSSSLLASRRRVAGSASSGASSSSSHSAACARRCASSASTSSSRVRGRTPFDACKRRREEDDDEDEDDDEENEEDEAEDEDKSAEGVEGNDSVLAAGAEKDNAEEDEEDADDAAGAPMVVPPRRSVSVSVLASMGTVAWVKDQRRRSSSSCATDSLA